jgi:sugar lactone lactonase YvrE
MVGQALSPANCFIAVSPCLRVAVSLLLLTTAALASATTAWEMTSYQDFIRGQFQGVSLSRDGRLTLAPKVDTLFSSGQAVVWSVAEGANGVLYVATGHRGRVYQVDPSGSSSLLWTADQPEVFAIATDRNGVLYAGTSPDGKVYRIDTDKGKGHATEYFTPKTRYIWSLATGPDGALYVGTGDQGKIYRVTSAGAGELYYDTGQSHVTGLAVDAQGRLLAGTEPNGILYRISAKDKAFVLYDASLPEIRAIIPQPDGTVYAAALGGSLAKRAQAATQAAQSGVAGGVTVQSAPQSVTVEAQEVQPGAEIKAQTDPTRPAQSAPTPQVTTQFTPAPDLTGVERSAIYRINPDNTVETLWSSKEEDVYDLLALPNQLLFSTDSNGRIYGLSRDRKITLVLQTNEGEATRLLPSAGSVLVATGDMGRIYRLGEVPGAAGSYESPVHDAGAASRWGSLSWRAEMAPSSTLVFRTRSGNSAKPDKTWSDWSDPLHDSAASGISSPNARYIQWKAEFAGAGGVTPILDNVTLAYLPRNSPPIVHSINVTLQMAPASALKALQQQSISPYTVTVTDSGDAGGGSGPAGTPTQTLSRAAAQQVTISWQADDPDGDRLVYNLYFRSDDERRWMLLKGDLHENAFTFDSDVLADGKYYFRVLASDKEVNPPATARDADLTSAPVMIDNTPPVVTIGQVRRTGTTAELEFEARDAASPLRRCEYSLDATGWVPLEAADGVIDSPQEKFVLSLDKLTPGEHLVVIRVLDSANNAGLAKVVLR